MYKNKDNLNFKEELQKMLDNDDDDDDNDENICKITGTLLTDKFVTLDCGHKFNYRAIYEEVRKQKFVFMTYDYYTLTIEQQQQFKNNYVTFDIDYYIKCPYCREIQFKLLPYYDDLELSPLYGINSSDKTLPSYKRSPKYMTALNKKKMFSLSDGSFKLYGVIFKLGSCSFKLDEGTCLHNYVAQVENTNLFYCKNHYKCGLAEYNYTKKQEKKEQKAQEKQKKKQNIVKTQEQPIQLYNPDMDDMADKPDNHIINVCQAITKSGLKKGNLCGCKVYSQNFCKRHLKTT